MRTIQRMVATVVLTTAGASVHAVAQTRVTTPMQQFGHQIGADYVLPNYTQFAEYWQILARESDRMVLDTIGTTAEGRPQLMAIITSPASKLSSRTVRSAKAPSRSPVTTT